MSLTVGARLGHNDVTALIGKGGLAQHAGLSSPDELKARVPVN